MALLALLVPAKAAAHGRGPIVALDDRLVVDRPVAGITVRVLDGDRSLHVTVDPSRTVVVRGYLGEPMLRFADGSVEANRSSPTASADRIVTAGTGWQRVAGGRSFAWHDHRLAPPAHGGDGTAGRWSVPVTIDGRPAAITGTFVRVPGPSIVPWLLGAAAAVAGIGAFAARRPGARATLVLVLAVVAGAAALLAIAAFSVRDAPTGGIEWFQLGGGAIVAAAAATILARTSGSRRTAAAGVIGALAAAAMLSSLPVFRHGVVISALPAALARLACAAAVVGGVCAAAVSLVADQPARVAPVIPLALAVIAIGGDPSVHPWPIGPGPRYRPPARKFDGGPVGALHCASGASTFQVHLEVFVNRRVVIVPAGIGHTPRCDYPIRTRTPIGVLDVAPRRHATIGDLFRLWGQPLTRHRIASFRSRLPVRTYVGGKRVRRDAADVTLTPKAQIVVELGAYVPPHRSFLFPPEQP